MRSILKFLNCEVPLLSKTLERVRVLPISDCHIGDPLFKERALKEKLYSVKYEPTILILTGDMLNNAIRSSVSNCYEEVIPAGDPQIDYLCDLLEPYKMNIGLIIPGNHEYRTNKEMNVDIARIYAERLGAPYAHPHGLLKIQLGKNSKGDPSTYVIYAHHGSGGGKARSGKTKRMIDQEWMIDGADIYMRSHTHIIEAFPSEVMNFDVRTMNTYTNRIFHVSTGTWLDTSEYAERMELPPLSVGCPEIYLYGKEKRIEVKV